MAIKFGHTKGKSHNAYLNASASKLGLSFRLCSFVTLTYDNEHVTPKCFSFKQRMFVGKRANRLNKAYLFFLLIVKMYIRSLGEALR